MPYNIPGGAFDVTVTMVYYLILNLHAAMIHLSMYSDPAVSDSGPLKSSSSSSLHPDPPSFYAELDSHVMFTNNVIYVFFRLFQVSATVHVLYTCVCGTFN